MEYSQLNAARRAYIGRHGNEATGNLIKRFGGVGNGDHGPALSSVPESNWPRLFAAFGGTDGQRPKGIMDIDHAAVWRRFNARAPAPDYWR